MATVSSIVSAATGGAGSLGTLYVKLVADASGVDQGMKDAERAIVGGATNITKAAMLAASAVVGLATAGVVEFAKFESSFAKVRQTVTATNEEFKEFETTFRKLATQLPINVNEINNIAAAAGQLGIEKDAIVGFTKVMIDLGNTTNLHGVEAAQNLARLANITQMSQKDFDRLGSTLAGLDTKTAATASEILNLSLRLGAIGHAIGMSNADILGFSAGLASIGVNAEAGGTAMTQTMTKIAQSVALGNKELQQFARVAGLTAIDFEALFKKNATEAILRFVEGLSDINKAGGDAFVTLDNLGLDGARIGRTLISAAESGELFRSVVQSSNKYWEDNNRLTEMANERYKTLVSQLTITWNRLKDMFITIGEGLTPALKEFNAWLQTVLSTDGELSERVRQFAQVAGPAMGVALTYIKGSFQNLAIEIKGFQILINDALILVDDLKLAAQKAYNAYVALHNIAHPIDTLRGQGLAKSTIGQGAEGDIRERREAIDELKKQMTELTKASSESMDKWQAGLPDVVAKMNALFMPLKRVGDETVRDNFEMGGFLAGVESKGRTAVTSLTAIELATRKMKAEMEAADQKVTSVLDRIGAPKPTGLEFGQGPRGMSKAELQLGAMSGISGLDTGTQQGLQIQTEIELNKRKVMELTKLGDQEGKLTEEVQRRKLDALKMFNQQAKNLQAAQQQQMMASFTSIGDSMLTIGTVFFGKQTAMYKAMFAASKAFAIAESVVKIEQGIASAAALPWPANLAAIASVVAATANIVSTIQAVKLEFAGGKALGGPVDTGKAFLVGEKGPEMFVPSSRGTIVPNEQINGGNIHVNINNYTNSSVDVQQRQEGNEKFLDVIVKRAVGEVASQVRDGRGDVNKAFTQTFQLRRAQQ